MKHVRNAFTRTNRGQMAKPILRAAALCAAIALVGSGSAFAKTLVFCSEGSPENFYPGINTTGTSFDANSQIYSRIVDFERGGTKVVPGCRKVGHPPDGKAYTFTLRKGVKWHENKNFKPTRDMKPMTSSSRSSGSGGIESYFKVTSSNHSYFNDMECRSC